MIFSWIVEGELMVSSIPDSHWMLSFLKDTGIRAIVSAVPLTASDGELAKMGIERLYLPIEDYGAPTLEQLKLFIRWTKFMQKTKQPVMVHCQAGMDRSPTLCACYLVVHKGMTADQAITEVRDIRGDDCICNKKLESFVHECEHLRPLLTDTYDQAFFDGRLLIDILRRRCPWDREQTPLTMMPNLLEETYEAWEAIAQNNDKEIASELGDVLLQVLMISRMLSETKNFDILNVTNAMIEKLVIRHPHVFANSKTDTPGKVLDQWNGLKEEKAGSICDIPATLPPLGRAERIMSFAKGLGFDWPKVEGVIGKLDEEVSELKEAIGSSDKAKVESELGDVVFVLLNLARFLDVNPELALSGTLSRFVARFRQIEELAKSTCKNIKDMTLDEMDAIWDRAKKEPYATDTMPLNE